MSTRSQATRKTVAVPSATAAGVSFDYEPVPVWVSDDDYDRHAQTALERIRQGIAFAYGKSAEREQMGLKLGLDRHPSKKDRTVIVESLPAVDLRFVGYTDTELARHSEWLEARLENPNLSNPRQQRRQEKLLKRVQAEQARRKVEEKAATKVNRKPVATRCKGRELVQAA